MRRPSSAAGRKGPGACARRGQGRSPCKCAPGHIPGPGEEGVNLDLDPELLEVVIGSKGPSQF